MKRYPTKGQKLIHRLDTMWSYPWNNHGISLGEGVLILGVGFPEVKDSDSEEDMTGPR